jgi:hypothetical protein
VVEEEDRERARRLIRLRSEVDLERVAEYLLKQSRSNC